MYKPSLLNFFPSISSQLQTLRDKKNKFSYERVLKEAVSLKAVHSISRHKNVFLYFLAVKRLLVGCILKFLFLALLQAKNEWSRLNPICLGLAESVSKTKIDGF